MSNAPTPVVSEAALTAEVEAAMLTTNGLVDHLHKNEIALSHLGLGRLLEQVLRNQVTILELLKKGRS